MIRILDHGGASLDPTGALEVEILRNTRWLQVILQHLQLYKLSFNYLEQRWIATSDELRHTNDSMTALELLTTNQY
jgi:hypothetical protein